MRKWVKDLAIGLPLVVIMALVFSWLGNRNNDGAETNNNSLESRAAITEMQQGFIPFKGDTITVDNGYIIEVEVPTDYSIQGSTSIYLNTDH